MYVSQWMRPIVSAIGYNIIIQLFYLYEKLRYGGITLLFDMWPLEWGGCKLMLRIQDIVKANGEVISMYEYYCLTATK